MTPALLPRARLRDVARGHGRLVGSRLDPGLPRGLVSPVEARVHLGLPYGDLAGDEARYLRARAPLRRDAAVVARAVVATLLAPPAGGRSDPRPRIVSARVDNVTVDEALARILAPPHGRRARMVHFVHPHALTLGVLDRAHAARLACADLVLPDGVGIRVAAALLGVAMRHNVNGTDLLPLLCREAAAHGVPLALVGAAPGVADACAARLVAATPGLRVPLVAHGYLDADGGRAVAARVRALGRCVALVGMGSPRQEAWAWRHLASARDATVLTVGGLFDFFSERVPRAPVAWRELGLEWAYRWLQEPRRLTARYLLGNPAFLALTAWQRATGE